MTDWVPAGGVPPRSADGHGLGPAAAGGGAEHGGSAGQGPGRSGLGGGREAEVAAEDLLEEAHVG